MTTKRIDELTAATSLTAADLIPIMDEATTTKKITAANARPYMLPTAAETLALLVTVDGAGSGLDADLLDGNSSAAFATAAQGATADTAVQPARTISTTAPLTGGGDLSANRTLAVSAASDTASGVVELATTAETQTGTDATRAVTPAGAAATFAPLAHNQAASTITSGTLDTARLGSGSATSSTYLRGDQTWATISAGGGYAIFGDGSDGTVTISGTTTLTRDMFYDVLTVQNGGVLKTAQFRVFAKTSVTVDAGGKLQCNGAAAYTADRWGGGTLAAGSAGAAAGNGVDGGTSAANGGAGGAVTTALGGAGGAGGNASATYTGGAGGAATAPAANLGGFRSLLQGVAAKALSAGGTTQLAGGGGGGAGALLGSGKQSGGGGGGGVLVLVAKAITNNGTISANGGNGGTGSGDYGGGGGGGGGVVIAVYNTLTGSDPVAAGGTGGTPGTTGTSGANGSAGTIIKLVNA